MTSPAIPASASKKLSPALELVHLPWDTQHFERKTGKLTGPFEDLNEVRGVLLGAKADGYALCYYLHIGETPLGDGVLANLGGLKAAGYIEYIIDLDTKGHLDAEKHQGVQLPGFSLEPYAGPADHPQLLQLGIDSGKMSRFRQDPGIDPTKCDELYSEWARKSASGELADWVNVATSGEDLGGLVTARRRGEDSAEIGLVSVSLAFRGQGVAGALLAFTHDRLRTEGVKQVTVVTQTENTPARRLYAAAGYRPHVIGSYYHFYPGNVPSEKTQ